MNKQNFPDIDPKWGELDPMHNPYVLAHFQARETDVLITTGPKAGTTWMQQILYQLKSGGDESFRSIETVVPWLERSRENKTWQELLAYYDRLQNPRIFKTHCTYPQTPGVDIAKFILTSRDPRDCCVSFYHHMMNLTDSAYQRIGKQRPKSFDEYFEQWMDFGAWYRNISSWWPHKEDDNVLWLRYEDLTVDLEQGIDQLLIFLDWQLAAEYRPRVLEYCSFAWMKNHSEKFSTFDDSQESYFKPGTFIRKGQVGDHKNLITQEQEKRILDRARQVLPTECLGFLNII